MKIKWSQELLSVGNAMIDSDHKNLIVLVNRMEDSIMAGDRVALSKAFELLNAYMRIHTQNEEKIADAINYPFAQDKLSLQQLMDEMRYMIIKLSCTYGEWPDNVLQMYSRFLSEWMDEHILKTNMRMKSILQGLPYDFIPVKHMDNHSCQTAMVMPVISYMDSKPSAC